MQSDNTSESSGEASSEIARDRAIIRVRAIMMCPSCAWRKAFKNEFHRKDIEMMVVALKVFDWLTCPRCGDLIGLNLEYDI